MARVMLDLSVLSTDSRLRGIGRYVRDLARGLAALPDEERGVTMLGLEHAPWRGEARHTTALVPAVQALDDSPLQLHRRWARRMRLVAPRAARDADLLHFGHPDVTPMRRVAPRLLVTCHDLIPLRYPQHYTNWKRGYGWGQRLLDRRRYHLPNHLIAVSQATADDLVSLLGVPADRISVVHNGVDLARWSPASEPNDQAVLARFGLEGDPYAVYVGAGDWRKNIEGMLEGLARARHRPGGHRVRLVWAGHLARRWREALTRGMRRRGLTGSVVTTDYIDDDVLAALYRHARMSIFVSRAEGFGYPVIEAMAAGCPVITCGHTSTGEIAGDAAILVDPEDHGAIADGIVTLARDDAAHADHRRVGLKQAARFSVEAMARGTAAVYRDLV